MNTLLNIQPSPARALALAVIHRIYISGHHVQAVLTQEINTRSIPTHEIPLATELIYGYLRYALRINAILKRYLPKIEKIPQALLLYLGIAIYEFLYLDSSIPASVIFYTVECVKQRYSIAFGRLANAVLRSILRHASEYRSIQSPIASNIPTAEDIAMSYSLPYYIWEYLVTRFQDHAHRYAQHFLARPCHTEDDSNPSTRILFEQLGLPNNTNALIWDCCSGIGGKRMTLNTFGFHNVIGSDCSLRKISQQNNSEGILLCADATTPPFHKESFDMVIADVPCSGTGTLRKRPDIKIHRKEHDIATLCALQNNIITNIAPTIKPKGLLLYITCSICMEENEKQIRNFITRNNNFSLEQEYILPPIDDINDIFYGAVLYKKRS